MESYIKKLGRDSLIISILLLIIGFLMTIKSVETVTVLTVLFGYVLVVDGIIHCISYFTISRDFKYFSYELAQAVIDILLGFFVVANARPMTYVLPVTIGLWIILDGIFKLQIAANIRGYRNTNWGLMLVSAFVAIFIGFAIMFNPSTSIDVITKLCGISLVISQLLSIYDDIYFLIAIKKDEKVVKNAKSTEKDN